jgi:hypothetical protein
MNGVVLNVAAAQTTLIQYIEVWHLADDGQTMRLQSYARLRGSVVDSGTSDRQIHSGEGIAGMAWNQRHAIILQEAPSELLQRMGTQNGLELTALIAYPVMKGQDVSGVVVLGISDGPGACEIWSRDDRDELSISASYYSGLKNLEFISRYVRFPKGAGLPGAVWKSGQAKLATDLMNSPAFMRSCDTDETQLNTGLALPVGSTAGNSDSILLLLSSHATPIANVFEIWSPADPASESIEFQCIASDWSAITECDVQSPLDCHAAVGTSWSTGRPVLSTRVPPIRLPRDTEIHSPTLRAVLAVPVCRGTDLLAVVVLMF